MVSIDAETNPCLKANAKEVLGVFHATGACRSIYRFRRCKLAIKPQGRITELLTSKTLTHMVLEELFSFGIYRV